MLQQCADIGRYQDSGWGGGGYEGFSSMPGMVNIPAAGVIADAHVTELLQKLENASKTNGEIGELFAVVRFPAAAAAAAPNIYFNPDPHIGRTSTFTILTQRRAAECLCCHLEGARTYETYGVAPIFYESSSRD